MSVLEKDTTRKGYVDKSIIWLQFEFDNNDKYKVEGICDSKVYAKKLEDHYPSSFYYLVL